MVLAALSILLAAGCGNRLASPNNLEEAGQTQEKEYIVVGFSQLGAESDWRSANTESIECT